MVKTNQNKQKKTPFLIQNLICIIFGTLKKNLQVFVISALAHFLP